MHQDLPFGHSDHLFTLVSDFSLLASSSRQLQCPHSPCRPARTYSRAFRAPAPSPDRLRRLQLPITNIAVASYHSYCLVVAALHKRNIPSGNSALLLTTTSISQPYTWCLTP